MAWELLLYSVFFICVDIAAMGLKFHTVFVHVQIQMLCNTESKKWQMDEAKDREEQK